MWAENESLIVKFGFYVNYGKSSESYVEDQKELLIAFVSRLLKNFECVTSLVFQ